MNSSEFRHIIHRYTFKSLAGQSLLELVIAMGVFAIVITSIITVVAQGRSLVSDSPQVQFATDYAQEGLEAARLIRDQDWNNLTDGIHGLTIVGLDWHFSGASDTKNGYVRTITVTPSTSNSKFVLSSITWTSPDGRSQQIQLETFLTNWTVVEQNNVINGDWTNPSSIGTADVGNGVAGTDVLVQNHEVYFSTASTQQNKADFSTFNVTDPMTPVTNASQDLGVSGISAITKSGNYVYASIANSNYEFKVIDVSNPSNPTVVTSVDFSNGVTQSLAIKGNILYVGMQQISNESEFFAVDVSNPASPQVIGSFEVNGDVNAIAIYNNRAYLATSIDTAELMVVDITNPSNITQLGIFDSTGPGDATSIWVKDETNVYLGLKKENPGAEFYDLNALSPSNITIEGSYDFNTQINDMVVVNHLAFLVTEDPNAEFRVLDVGNPAAIYSYGSLNFPQAATGIAFENNTIYCSVRSNNALRIIGPT